MDNRITAFIPPRDESGVQTTISIEDGMKEASALSKPGAPFLRP